MKKLASTLTLSLLLVASFTPSYAENVNFLTTTIEDIGRPYTVIDGVCVYQQFPEFSLIGDPLEISIGEAFKKMVDIAKKAGADALVGFDFDFNSRPMKGEEGRLLLCGTLVKFKN